MFWIKQYDTDLGVILATIKQFSVAGGFTFVIDGVEVAFHVTNEGSSANAHDGFASNADQYINVWLHVGYVWDVVQKE